MKLYNIDENYIHWPSVEHFDDSSFTDEYQKEVYEYAELIFKRNNFKSVMDIGCGSGFKLIKHFDNYDTLGIDLPKTVNYLRNKYPHKSWNDNLKPTVGYDIIICSDVIEHFADPDELLEIIKQCKPKLIIISTPDRTLINNKNENGPPDNHHHFREWTKDEFYNYIKESGFKILKHIICNKKQGTQLMLCSI